MLSPPQNFGSGLQIIKEQTDTDILVFEVMNFNYQETVETLSIAERLYFYQLLAHFLTVQMRGILFFEGVADSERVDRAKWLNEIAHRITYKVFAMHKNLFEW